MTTTAPVPAAAPAQRRLIALVQILGLSVWFSATAIAPSLRTAWQLSSAQAVWLTASVQLGFVAGAVTSSALNLPDRFPPHRLMAAAATGAATCTVLFASLADGLALAVPLRVATGICLAGVYPVGMKLTASWAAPADRGRAFGILIGSLTLGSALPHALAGLGPLPWRGVMLTAAGSALLAAVVAVRAVRPGPLLAAGARPDPRVAFAAFRDRGPRLANLGYFGHMWELYALWTWLPAFLLAGAAARQDGAPLASSDRALASLLAFGVIGLAGAAGCLLGGWASDRFGRSPAAVAAMVTSGACCLLSPLVFTAPKALALVVLGVWGASVIADSGIFSTALSETADQRYVGTALTVQTAIGFLLTVVTIQFVPVLAEHTGWRWAFLLLAPGPLLGAVAMRRFRTATPPRPPS